MDDDSDEAAEEEDEPFLCDFTIKHRMLAEAPGAICLPPCPASAGDHRRTVALLLLSVYADAKQSSLTPDGVFAELERKVMCTSFTQTLAPVLAELHEQTDCRAVRLGGREARTGEDAWHFPALTLTTRAILS